MNSPAGNKLMTYLVVPIIGVLMVVFGVYMIQQDNARKSWPTTQGMVNYSSYDLRNRDYKVKVGFAVNGETYEVRASVANYKSKPETGTFMDVVYNPKNPNNAYVKGSKDFSVIIFLSLPVGLFLIAVPAIAYRKQQQSKEASSQNAPIPGAQPLPVAGLSHATDDGSTTASQNRG